VSGVGYTWTNYFFTAVLSNITSTSAKLSVTNNESNGLWLAFLRIRGNRLVNKKMYYESTDATSAAKGPRRLRLESPWLQDRGFAQAYAPLLLNHLKNPSKDPVIALETRSAGLAIDLLDKVTLTSAKLGINTQYDVGGIGFRWLEATGQAFLVEIHLQSVLYSTATITPQPYYPANPPVPGSTNPPGTVPPVTPPGGTGPTLACLSDYPTSSGPTGPFGFGGGVMDNSHTASNVAIGKWVRTIYNPNRTYIEVDAVWETGSGSVWTPDTSFDFQTITGYDNLNVARITGIVGSGGVADGVRTYQFSNTVPYFTKLLQFVLPASSGSVVYSRGSLVGTVTAAISNTSGEEFALTLGNWYCIESSGGPWTAPAHSGSYTFDISLNGGANWAGPWGYSSALGRFEGYTYEHIPYYEQVGNYARVWFYAATSSVKIICGTSNPTGGTGSITCSLYDASAGASDKKVTIRSVKVYNVCDGSAGL
jgi:hypothetical protein